MRDRLDDLIDNEFEQAAELRRRKRHDYSNNNLYAAQDLGVEPWRGVLLRMSDKWERIKHLVFTCRAANFESIEDSLRDLGVYAFICLALRKEGLTEVAADAEPCLTRWTPAVLGALRSANDQALDELFQPLDGIVMASHGQA